MNLMVSHAKGERAVKVALRERKKKYVIAHVTATANRMRKNKTVVLVVRFILRHLFSILDVINEVELCP